MPRKQLVVKSTLKSKVNSLNLDYCNATPMSLTNLPAPTQLLFANYLLSSQCCENVRRVYVCKNHTAIESYHYELAELKLNQQTAGHLQTLFPQLSFIMSTLL